MQLKDYKYAALAPESSESAFVPLAESNNLDALPAVKYERTTDACAYQVAFAEFLHGLRQEKSPAFSALGGDLFPPH